MNLKKNVNLKQFNTFGLSTKAKQFSTFSSVETLQAVLKLKIQPIRILGGGSNLLLTKNLDGLLLKNEIKGKEIVRRFKKSVYVKTGGGENWHEFVLWCIYQGLGGIENLSLIPGTVGASPIQNIGAYGVELEQVFHQLEAVEIATGNIKIFKKKDCQFGYRNSIFKQKLKGKYCITHVWFKLTTVHQISLKYGAIREVLAKAKIDQPNIRDISNAVIRIRSSKLPDPAKLGNSGSFFKNPEISKRAFKIAQKQFPNIIFYNMPNGKVKVPAGWLIEQCGWKGKRVGHTGAHAKQALVLVNYGKAKGSEIFKLAQKIQHSVKAKFNISLEMEVNVW